MTVNGGPPAAAQADTRAGKIARILAERTRNAALAEELGADLTRIGDAVRELDRIRLDLLPRVEDDARASLSAWAAPLREIADQVTLEQAALERVLARLRRSTLNIGIVGRAGQGKSRFLQTLTGLTTREIPDGNMGFCTGVPSMIAHVPTDEPYADVFFHSPATFLSDAIRPYYEQLGLVRQPPIAN